MSTTATTNVDVCVRVQRELLGAGHLELADELIDPHCVDHGDEVGIAGQSGDAVAPRGPDAIKRVVGWLHGAFPDLGYEIKDAFGGGDRVALRCMMRGTHTGEFLGRAPTGRSFAVQQIHLFRVSDGRIAEHWACRDDAGMMRQLRLIG